MRCVREMSNAALTHREQSETTRGVSDSARHRPFPGGSSERFYRPELDALRLFAFLFVLIHHGPVQAGAFLIIRRMGGFGLSLFFFLSAYLITQLLLQEREESGTVHLKSFYVRRILRIWPLYFAALLASILIGAIPRHKFAVDPEAIAGLSLFIVNWLPRTLHMGLFSAMWSISVEEQFYLIWPVVTKLRGRTSTTLASIALIMAAGATISILSYRGWLLWYNTGVEFLFFGTGALLAVILRGRKFDPGPVGRMILLGAGLISWIIAAISGVGTDDIPGLTATRLYLGFGAADQGCVLIFLAFLGVTNLPRTIVYLGKISYGLYVFHLGMLELSRWLLGGMTRSLPGIIAVDALAFVGCVGMAAVSYRYLERPFLRFKQRFEFVRSRPAG
jgi:peptidoglycan/LPS O-acetylase OafA/YrhL